MTETEDLVDWKSFHTARAQLGANFVRILGYFEEDGTKSVAAIEDAMREKSCTALVIPAHTLKGEAYQFGAQKLAESAEKIEMVARHCVETRAEPDEVLSDVVGLRRLFEETLAKLKQESSPLVERRRTFGQRSFGTNARYGQL